MKIDMFDLGLNYAVVIVENKRSNVYYFYHYNNAIDFIESVIDFVSYENKSIKVKA